MQAPCTDKTLPVSPDQVDPVDAGTAAGHDAPVSTAIMRPIQLIAPCLLALGSTLFGQINQDESKVPDYTLPDPLSGVTSADGWPARRAQLMDLLAGHVYGRMPPPLAPTVEIASSDPRALEGRATRSERVLTFTTASGKEVKIRVLLFVPNNRTAPSPLFLGLNFRGNHTISKDPAITPPAATKKKHARGSRANRWPVDRIIARGYALATAFYGDIDPDHHDDFANGVHPLFPMRDTGGRKPDAWGSIGAWAWGLSRIADHLIAAPEIDGDRVAVMGHSRLGKTALWAGACDERFKLVISNNSGCGGAALSRRRFGETVARINKVFPHWFCSRFDDYNHNEDALPVDQHTLIACIAPRACLVSSARKDRWADPRGEFLSVVAATPVYRLLGLTGMSTTMPASGVEPEGTLGYRIREGKHDVTKGDWGAFLAFADRVLR